MKGKNCLIVLVFLFVMFLLMAGCGVVAAIFLPSAFSTASYQESYVTGEGEKKVALIDIKGEISNSDSGGLLSPLGAVSAGINAQIDQAIADPNVIGILIEMDTPGGEIVASDLVNQKIYEARESGLYVVTYMYTLGASGGYYIAAASDMILANELTTTGSIGVYSVVQDVSGLYQKLGIEQRIIKHGDFKTGAGLFDENDQGEEDQIYQQMVDEAYNKFVDIVVEGRGMKPMDVLALAEGQLFTGKQAVENGLIDGLGGYNEAVEEMKTLTGVSNFQVVRYSVLDFWGQVFGVLSGFNVNGILYELAKQEQGAKIMYMME